VRDTAGDIAEAAAEQRPTRARIVGSLLYALAAVFVAFGAALISGLATQVTALEKELAALEDTAGTAVARIEDEYRAEVARLDESNRTRRGDIAAIEERVAAIEAIHGGALVDHARQQ
jgi:cell division protein FtsB